MKTTDAWFPGLLAACIAGCSATIPEVGDTGLLSATVGVKVPDGTVPAFIYEIDGERIFHDRRVHRVNAGVHTLRVWPAKNGPPGATPVPGAHARHERLNVESMTLEVEPGARYYVAARMRKHRTYVTRGQRTEPLGPWQTTILPVVTRTTSPRPK